MHYLQMYTLATNGAKCYITISLNSGLNDSSVMDFICIFYLLSCTCYSKNIVIFLLSVECRFQQYQG